MRSARTLIGAAAAAAFACGSASAAIVGPTAGSKSILLRGGLTSPLGDMKGTTKSGINLGLLWRSQFSEYMGMEGEISWTLLSSKIAKSNLHIITPHILFLRAQVPIMMVVPFVLLGGGVNVPLLSAHEQIDFGLNASVAAGGGVEVYLGTSTSVGVDLQYRRHFDGMGWNLSYWQAALRVGFHY